MILGITGDRVMLHRGYRGAGHVLVEFGLDLPFAGGPDDYMHREITARHISMALAFYVLRSVPWFAEAVLATSSLELAGSQLARFHRTSPDATSGTSEARLPSHIWPLDSLTGCCSESPSVSEETRSTHAVAFQVQQELCSLSRVPAHERSIRLTTPDSLSGVTLGEPASPCPYRTYERFPVVRWSVTVLGRCDVLVVGGGASGASAAITCAREGVETLLVDMNPGLGGTGTLGGVFSYWYGRRTGFAGEIQRLTDDVQTPLGHTAPNWKIEAKMYALLCAGARNNCATSVVSPFSGGFTPIPPSMARSASTHSSVTSFWSDSR